jgi:regulator of protease activity HflC (stomatin/prohibitin superfamily)
MNPVNWLPRGVVVMLSIVILLPLLFMLFFQRVVPTEIGVKQHLFGDVGVIPEDYEAGFHVGVTGVHRWYFLPRNTHFLHFVTDAGRDTLTTEWEPPLSIRTRDNNETTIEITVPYRIRDGEGHAIVAMGLRTGYRGRVNETVKNVLRTELAQLSSEDYQDTDIRLGRAQAVLPLLNEQLAKFHVEALAILVRKVSFQPEYEEKLQEKQYLQQKANLDRAQGLVANEEKVTNSIEKQIGAAEVKLTAEWDKRFQEERGKYEVAIAEIAAQAQVYQSQTRADADARLVGLVAQGQLALDQARALRDQLRNQALGTRGGRIFLALQAAQNLKVESVMLDSSDPRVPILLDLDELTTVLVGQPTGAGATP